MSTAQLKLADDAMDKGVADVREEAVVAVPEASAAGGSDAPAPAVNEKAEVPEDKAKGDSPELTDQTNFLPTRQVCSLVVPCTLRSRTNAVSDRLLPYSLGYPSRSCARSWIKPCA